MNQPTFEQFVEELKRRVEAHMDEAPSREHYQRGYAVGKMMGEIMKELDASEEHEFNEGVDMGLKVALVKRVH